MRVRHATPLFVLLVLAYALAFQGSRPLWEPDEGRYPAVALRMLDDGDPIVPRLNAETEHWGLAAYLPTEVVRREVPSPSERAIPPGSRTLAESDLGLSGACFLVPLRHTEEFEAFAASAGCRVRHRATIHDLYLYVAAGESVEDADSSTSAAGETTPRK